jgi:hypothetical protein
VATNVNQGNLQIPEWLLNHTLVVTLDGFHPQNEERKMAVEYYVKRKMPNGDFKLILTCETSEKAVKESTKLQALHPKRQYGCFYSPDAIDKYVEERDNDC